MTIDRLKNAVLSRLASLPPSEGKKNNESDDLNPPSVFEIDRPINENNEEEIHAWIREGIAFFREWYQPVDFGNGLIAHATQPPDWLPKPELFNRNDMGIGKWNYIIKNHMPDVKGKRVLDLGCSSGVFTLELARMGAREVVGIDRNINIQHKSTDVPPRQDVIAQAKFVKRAFELIYKEKYPITYIAQDIGNLEELDLGHFDVILALCVIYHEMENMPATVKKLSDLTDCLILQANQGQEDPVAEYAEVKYHVDLLIRNGFTDIEIFAPKNYPLPLLVCRK